MNTSQALVDALKAELRRAGITYAALARELGIAESSVKRIFAKGDMPLSRVDEVLAVLKMDFTELAERVVHAQPLRHELTLAQEEAVVADRKLLLAAICALSQWTFEQIRLGYRYTDAELTGYFARLDRLGILELRPMNRYRLKLDKTFRWRPDGPVMAYFRDKVVPDYFGGGFDAEGELLMLVHGSIGRTRAALLVERLQRLGQDFAQQHLADQKLPDAQKDAYTLVVAMRSWLFAAFRDLKREGG
jgi:transcriptional regulator with XRE-family HTH domain